MIGTKLNFVGTHKGKTIWETTVLPFIHPETGEQVDIVYTEGGSMIVSPEKRADIGEEHIKKMVANDYNGERFEIVAVVTPEKI